jgi:hypothetical protein
MDGWMDTTEGEGVTQVEFIGEMRNAYFYSGNLKERDRFGTGT